MLNENFVTRFEKESTDVSSIMTIMRHPKRQKAEKLLRFIDDILTYYMSRSDAGVRYPIVYIPASEPWAQDVCIEYITLKMALLYSRANLDRISQKLKEVVNYPADFTAQDRKYKMLKERRKYAVSIKKLLLPRDKNLPEATKNKNLIVCSPFNEHVNPYLKNYCGSINDIADTNWALIQADIDVKALDSPFRANRNCCNLENIFVILAKNANGRMSDHAYSFQRTRIERLNQLGAAVKNVFYFYFSTLPYKLQHICNRKTTLASSILQVGDVKVMSDFISLTSEESDYIFNHESKQQTLIVQPEVLQDDISDIKELVDDALEEYPYNVQVRNALSLCSDETSQRLFQHAFGKDIEGLNEMYFNVYFKCIQEVWDAQIFPKVDEFMNGETDICLILDYYAPNELKQHICAMFKDRGYDVKHETLKSLVCKKSTSGKYSAPNKANKIVVLSYQGHYIGKPYTKYPNSFDPFYVDEGQQLLNVFIPFILDPYYAKHHYDYMNEAKYILSSDYRSHGLDCTISLPPKPTAEARRQADDSKDASVTLSVNGRASGCTARYRMSIADGRPITLDESALIICKDPMEEVQIVSASSLFNLHNEHTDQTYQVCPLSKIQDELETILNKQEVEIRRTELFIRQDARYALTEDEVSSESELWQILLRKKVQQHTAKVVYDEIMARIPEVNRLQIRSFERWYDDSSDMILPRSRQMQNSLFAYLSIMAPYDKIIRRKKAQRSTKTEQKNLILRTFLCDNLFADDFQDSFDGLSDEVKDMLGIDKPSDIKALIDLLKPEIQYNQLKNISKNDKN